MTICLAFSSAVAATIVAATDEGEGDYDESAVRLA